MQKYSFKILIVFIVFSIMGIAVLPFLPVDLVPDYKPPKLTISYNLPASPPFIVEQEATAIFENLFSKHKPKVGKPSIFFINFAFNATIKCTSRFNSGVIKGARYSTS